MYEAYICNFVAVSSVLNLMFYVTTNGARYLNFQLIFANIPPVKYRMSRRDKRKYRPKIRVGRMH